MVSVFEGRALIKVFKYRVPRKIFVTKKDEVNENCMILGTVTEWYCTKRPKHCDHY
jgi:hypothetical protein